MVLLNDLKVNDVCLLEGCCYGLGCGTVDIKPL